MAASIAMIAITTKSSIGVNPRLRIAPPPEDSGKLKVESPELPPRKHLPDYRVSPSPQPSPIREREHVALDFSVVPLQTNAAPELPSPYTGEGPGVRVERRTQFPETLRGHFLSIVMKAKTSLS